MLATADKSSLGAIRGTLIFCRDDPFLTDPRKAFVCEPDGSARCLDRQAPVADDDHVDATAGRRGGVPAIAIQVKTVRDLDRDGSVEAKADYPAGHVREHPAFLYAVLLLPSVTIECAWLIPSP